MDPPDLNNAANVKEDLSMEESGSWTILGKRPTVCEESSGVQIVESDSEKEDQEPAVVAKSEISPKGGWKAESQLDESSDGISVISESDITSGDKIVDQEDDGTSTLHFTETLNLSSTYEPLTPPYTPTSAATAHEEFKEKSLQVQKTGDENALEPIQSVVPLSHEPVSNVKWIVFSVLATAMAAIILGNSMRVTSRVDEINFEHEKRISELELENNILKQEMNKLRHMYTRSELDEQVQRAEFEWQERLRNSEPDDLASEDAAPQSEVPESEPIRKVPPQDTGVKRKVVWSGDEEEPMLIVDKDYVLPAFCYNQDRAVQDDLFFEYSAKYCDVKKRKIEAKQKKAEFKEKHQKATKQDNYNKYINIKPNQQQPSEAHAGDSGRLASPFNIDYQKAFDAIKAEGSVIVEALGSILDLSPEPESMLSAKVVEASEPPIEAVTPPEIQQPKPPASSDGDRRPQDSREYQKSTKPARDERRDDYRKKEDDQRKSKEYNAEREKYYKEKGKGKDGRKEDGYDKKKQKYDGQKRHHGSEEHSGEQDKRKKHHQNGKSNEQHYKKRSHDDDDHDKDYRKKFEGGKHGDHGSGKHGSGEQYRRKHWESDEGSYLDQYKRDEYRKDKRFDRDEERNGHHQKKHEGDWNGKRYKGREEYREKREGERGSGQWQERMKDGRQEARDSQRRKAEKDNNWYLERANQREEERIFQQT